MNRIEFLVCAAIAGMIIKPIVVSAQIQKKDQSQSTKAVSQIFSTLKSEFQKAHPGNIRTGLYDVRALQADPTCSGMTAKCFLVLANAVYYDANGYCCQGELFGVFAFDDSLIRIVRTIDIINGGDYTYNIAKVWKDTLTIRGESGKEGLDGIEKKYKLNLVALLSQSDSARMHEGQSRTESSQIVATLRQQFHKDHPGNIRVQLDDVRAYQADPMYLGMPANRFLVTARGLYYDSTGHYQDELLGIFVFGGSLTTILRTIDYITYAQQYTFKIFRVWKDTLTVLGDVIDYNWQPIQKRYKLHFWEKYE